MSEIIKLERPSLVQDEVVDIGFMQVLPLPEQPAVVTESFANGVRKVSTTGHGTLSIPKFLKASASPKSTAPFTDVGVDLDGVLYPFTTAFRKYCEEVLGMSDLPEVTVWEFYDHWNIELRDFLKYLSHGAAYWELFNSEPPMEGTAEGWNLLKDSGVQVHIITSRVTEGWEQTVAWLGNNGLMPDHLHFTRNKSVLANVSSGRSAAIDDHTVYFDEMTAVGIHAALRTHPWNTNHPTGPNQRFASFRDFAQFIYNTNMDSTLKAGTQ